MKVTKSKVVIFSAAIALVSVFFFAYAVQAVYPAPQYEDFCGDRDVVRFFDNKVDCEAVGGMWDPSVEVPKEVGVSGHCDSDFSCRNEYEDARRPYEQKVFFANLIIGVVVFVVAFFLGLEAVSSGLMGGAVLLMVYGSIRYWEELTDIWRTLMLGFALVVLIWLGYNKLRD